ncbi:response regulator [Rhizobium grahamii]|uniref:Response regulator n=1 Tax=Rhizobium grahamii TaxID=1120045 RepID=A0A370KI82_9HYPH|nr:response regulator [Rhizobium grahamii]RDJ05598.1 response regulator [Rhizobium grahamii]
MKQESLDPEPADAILVVEPDIELYSHMAAQIRSAGLSAISARNAAEALGLLGQRADIALVFTAVNMPGLIDGVALAVRVHRERPDLAIVITSAVVNLRQSTLPRRCRFLRKPYEPEEAIKCFRFLLDLDPAISQGGSTVAD